MVHNSRGKFGSNLDKLWPKPEFYTIEIWKLIAKGL